MNRYLLAGAAAAALALGAGAANAQAKFEVKVGGDAYFEAGYVDQDLDSGLRSTEFRNRMRINIIPSAKADNGLEYGARMRIRANSGTGNNRTTDADRAYIFAQGTFGQVRLGVTNSFNDETYVSAPTDYLPLALVDQVQNWFGPNTNIGGNGPAATVTGNSIIWPSLNTDNNATKIVYFSPRFAGLQVGASYTPRNDNSGSGVSRSKNLADAGFSGRMYQDMVEVGANYNNTFGGVTVKASAGYMWADAPSVAGVDYKNLNGWQAGATVGYAGFSVGGSYTDYGKSGLPSAATNKENTRNWVVGAQYTTGPIVVGANYKNGKDAGFIGAGAAGDRELQVYEIGVGYTVAPGLTLQAQYDYFDLDAETSALSDKGNVVLVRTILAF